MLETMFCFTVTCYVRQQKMYIDFELCSCSYSFTHCLLILVKIFLDFAALGPICIRFFVQLASSKMEKCNRKNWIRLFFFRSSSCRKCINCTCTSVHHLRSDAISHPLIDIIPYAVQRIRLWRLHKLRGCSYLCNNCTCSRELRIGRNTERERLFRVNYIFRAMGNVMLKVPWLMVRIN